MSSNLSAFGKSDVGHHSLHIYSNRLVGCEQFQVWVNDSIFSGQSFSQGTSGDFANTTQILPTPNLVYNSWNDQLITYVLTVNTTGTSLKLGFGSTLDQMWSDEAWGVDNLTIREQVSGTTGTYSEGTTGNDTQNSGNLYDSYAGNVGNDVINGGGGRDYLSGGSGTDTIDGGTHSDFILGGWDADHNRRWTRFRRHRWRPRR